MPKVTGLGHVGIYIADPTTMVDFYANFLGMTVTDQDDRITFLSAQPDIEHHEFALVHDPSRHTDAQQISFTVATLADLREFHRQIIERGLQIDRVVTHGNAFGCYFRDLEGNRIEVYWHTGKDWPQPYAEPLDLTLSEQDLVAMLEGMPTSPAATT